MCGSSVVKNVNGTPKRVREYPWGSLEIENPETSEFSILRTLLLRTHLLDLVDMTHNVLYESFRQQKLTGMSLVPENGATGDSASPMDQLEAQKVKHEAKMKKMEQEMTQVFAAKVREKEDKLKASEEKLLSQHDAMQRDMLAERAHLANLRREFEAEKQAAALAAHSPVAGQGKKDDTISKKKGFFS